MHSFARSAGDTVLGDALANPFGGLAALKETSPGASGVQPSFYPWQAMELNRIHVRWCRR